MSSEQQARYLQCVGPEICQHPPGAAAVLIRIVKEGEQEGFAGYVVLNDRLEVIEKSSEYGIFEGDASGFEHPECSPASRADFQAAWDRPYAERSRWRRFLSSLNGARDSPKPNDDSLDTN